jgi:hypothetical protein
VRHHLAQRGPDDPRRIEHGGRVEQVARLAGMAEPLVQERDHRLGGGEVAGRGQGQDVAARLLEEMQLLHRGDVVDPGIDPGIGRHDDAVLEQDSEAVGHDCLP